jgi:muramidase (phage lysozyme)
MTKEEIKDLEEVLDMYSRGEIRQAFRRLLEIVITKKMETETDPCLKRMDRIIGKLKKEVRR